MVQWVLAASAFSQPFFCFEGQHPPRQQGVDDLTPAGGAIRWAGGGTTRWGHWGCEAVGSLEKRTLAAASIFFFFSKQGEAVVQRTSTYTFGELLESISNTRFFFFGAQSFWKKFPHIWFQNEEKLKVDYLAETKYSQKDKIKVVMTYDKVCWVQCKLGFNEKLGIWNIL